MCVARASALRLPLWDTGGRQLQTKSHIPRSASRPFGPSRPDSGRTQYRRPTSHTRAPGPPNPRPRTTRPRQPQRRRSWHLTADSYPPTTAHHSGRTPGQDHAHSLTRLHTLKRPQIGTRTRARRHVRGHRSHGGHAAAGGGRDVTCGRPGARTGVRSVRAGRESTLGWLR